MEEKRFEHDDPFELIQMFLDVPADDDFYTEMARTFIEEYMMMGWNDDEIMALFHDPYYRAPYKILQNKGEVFVSELLNEVRYGSRL